MPGAFGAPEGSSLAFPVAPNAATQGAQAFADARQNVADQQAKLAETQAVKAGAELQGQQANDAILARLAAVPGIEKSPVGLKALESRFKTLGVPLPRDEMGNVDMKAVQAIIRPSVKPWSEWTPDEINKEMALDPKLRSLPADAPEEARTRQAVVPITEKGIESLMKQVTAAEAKFGVGHGNPKELEAAALSAYKSIAARGGDTSLLDPYLNADHTALKPDYLNQKAGELVEAQINNLHSLGVYRTDETQLREKMLAEKKREWDTESANVKAQLTLKQRQQQIQASQFAQKMSMQQQNLSARYASIANSANANTFRSGALGINMYENFLKDTDKQQSDAETMLTKTQGLINQYLNVPNADTNSPVYQGLLTQASSLHDSIYGNPAKNIPSGSAALQAARETSRQGIANIYSQITGQPASAPGPTNVNVNLTIPGGSQGQKFGAQTTSLPQGAVKGMVHANGKSIPGYQLNGQFFDMQGNPIK